MPDAAKRTLERATELVGVSLLTGAWLTLLDRLGHVLASVPAWCGLSCTLRVTSAHVGAALVLTAVVLASRGFLGRLAGWRWHAALALLSAALLLGASVVFSYRVRTAVEIAHVPFAFLVAAAIAGTWGLVVSSIALLRRRRIYSALLALASLFTAVVDATIYPGQVPDVHLALYSIQAAAGVVGVGMPLYRALRERPLHRPLAWGLMVVALGGCAVVWLRERATTASASRTVRRLLHVVPKHPPARALHDALEADLRGAPGSPPGGSPSPERRLSVLLVTVDALRADALLPAPVRGSYLKGDETPFLDAWLPTTSRFVNAYASGPVTLESMFALLRGVSVGDPLGGADIPALARSLDMTTVAVVPWFFGLNEDYGASVEAFDRVDVYDLERQMTQMAAFDDALSELGGERFFLWTHFFCTHLPYCGEGGRPLSHGLKSPFEVTALEHEYRQAVKWLDAQMKHLVQALERTGRRDSTIIVLASDHGEHLGEGLVMGHGDALHDLDIRVPLVFYVPGMPGRTVHALAANAQVLPTLMDLLGEPPSPAHTARSLLPSMSSAWERSPDAVYVKGVVAQQHALVTQDRLLLYDEAVAEFAWLAREPGLVDGRADELSLSPGEERAATALIVRANPEPFFAARGDARTLELLRARLSEVNASTRDEDVDFLLRLAVHLDEPSLSPSLERAYAATPSPERKVRTALHLEPLSPVHWSGKLGDLLAGGIGTEAELRVLRALTGYGLSRIAARPDLAVRPTTLTSADDPRVVAAWLDLLGSGESRAPALRALAHLIPLTPTLPEASESTRRALRAVAALSLDPGERESPEARNIARWARAQLDSTERTVRLGGCRALGRVGTPGDIARLTQATDHDPSIGVRRAARRSLELLVPKPASSAVAPSKVAR